jgi:hypothetical protein
MCTMDNVLFGSIFGVYIGYPECVHYVYISVLYIIVHIDVHNAQ